MIKKNIELFFKYKFALLLVTLMAQIFIPVYFIGFFMHSLMSYIFMTLTFIVSILIFKNMKRRNAFKVFAVFVLFVMLINWVDYFTSEKQIIHILRLLLIASLYVIIFINIFKEFVSRQEVDLDFIFGAISAFLLLGLLGSFMSVLIEEYYPGSFSFLNNSIDFQDHIYFNFVTLTTLGYGDVLPISPQGQMHSVLVTVVGQLYLTITIGLIVGRYLMNIEVKKGQ